MKVCGYCGTRFNDNAGEYAVCSYCENEMQVVTIEEIATKDIDCHDVGISALYLQDFLTQRDYIMASKGSDSDKLAKLNECINKEFERKQWHKSEGHSMITQDDDDWSLAEQYKEQHSPYNNDNVLIEEVWKDRDNFLCVQYVSSAGRQLNWFHYTVENGELGWW